MKFKQSILFILFLFCLNSFIYSGNDFPKAKKEKGKDKYNLLFGLMFLDVYFHPQGLLSAGAYSFYQYNRTFLGYIEYNQSVLDKLKTNEEAASHPEAFRIYRTIDAYVSFIPFGYTVSRKTKIMTSFDDFIRTGNSISFINPKFTTVTFQKENKFGVRAGIYNFSQNHGLMEPIPKDGYYVTAYTANSFFVGISKTAFASQKFGKGDLLRLGVIYFDYMFPYYKNTSCKKYDATRADYVYYSDVNIFKFTNGWRFGFLYNAINAKFPVGKSFGIEIGRRPAPQDRNGAGTYFMARMSFIFGVPTN